MALFVVFGAPRVPLQHRMGLAGIAFCRLPKGQVRRMETGLLLVSSVTYAMKAREILLHSGIRAFVQRVPRTAETGCGYAVYLPQHLTAAEKILQEHQIHVLGRMGTGDDG